MKSSQTWCCLGMKFQAVKPLSVWWIRIPITRKKASRQGVRVAVCGACGHLEMFTNWNKELLEAYKKGLVTEKA